MIAIKATDLDELLAFLGRQDMRITIEACGRRKTFNESTCAKAVNGNGRTQELHYLMRKRMIELARDILYERGELDLT